MAEREEMRLERERGESLTWALCEKLVCRLFRRVALGFHSLATRAAPELVGLASAREVEAVLRRHTNAIGEELADVERFVAEVAAEAAREVEAAREGAS